MLDWQMNEVGENSDILVFELTGRMETLQCDYFFSAVESRIAGGDKKLIIDCGDLEYISSMGLGTLLRAHARMKAQGGDVKLASVNGLVADVIQIVRLDKILQLYETVEEAVDAYKV